MKADDSLQSKIMRLMTSCFTQVEQARQHMPVSFESRGANNQV